MTATPHELAPLPSRFSGSPKPLRGEEGVGDHGGDEAVSVVEEYERAVGSGEYGKQVHDGGGCYVVI
jgi:hypothetical protein